LAVGTSRHDADIAGLFDGNDHASSEDDLLVGLLKVDQVDTSGVALPDIALHLGVAGASAKVDGARQQLSQIIGGGNVDVHG